MLIALLALNVTLFSDDASFGPNQLALLFVGMVVIAMGRVSFGKNYHEIQEQIVLSIKSAIPACLILLMVGPLISLWILSGVVPGLIYFGLEIIHPRIFLPLACLSCALISLSIGSSWSTIGTIGIALMAVGSVLDVHLGMVAGAVISGAYFGDKMSPLSDTTNLAPAIAETDLFTHIRYMLYTTGPAFLMSLLLFFFLSFFGIGASEVGGHEIQKMQMLLADHFNLNISLLIPPVVVLGLIAIKFPPLPSLFIGCLAGAVLALTTQYGLLVDIAGSDFKSLYSLLITVSHTGTDLSFGHDQLDSLLSRGGMEGMLVTVWLILSAMFFGGALESVGMLKSLTRGLLYFVRGTGSLVGSTIAACLTLNFTASDQYLAIVVPGKMFKKSYDDYQLSEENLSRSLEDGATMTSVLVPWNTCGAYASGVLGVSAFTYAPFCFFNILSPLASLFVASIKWKIRMKMR